MAHKQVWLKILSLLNSFALLIQLAAPIFFYPISPVFAADSNTAQLEYVARDNAFDLTIFSSDPVSYTLSYIYGDNQTDGVTGSGQQSPFFRKTINAGTCSTDDCVNHRVKSGTLEWTTGNESGTIVFTIDNGKLVEQEPDPTPTPAPMSSQLEVNEYSSSIMGGFTCQNDVSGENDEPGQKDLTRMCSDSSDTTITTTWNWDDIAWSGNNSGDACNLFDTDGDGNVNYAVCVTIGNEPAVIQSTTRYSCGDNKPDRCTNPISSLPSSANTSCSVKQDNSDPFSAGNAYPKDTQGTCSITYADVGGSTNAQLIDVCSYPSQEPNSDPSDCIIATQAQTGTLTVIKHVLPISDPGLFNLAIDGFVYATAVGDNGTTGTQVILTGDHTVSESGSNPTDLTNYSTTISCTDSKSTIATTQTVDERTWSLSIAKDQDVVCTITNSRKYGSITVVKEVINNNGGTKVIADFPLYLNGNRVTSGTPNQLVPGMYTVTETQLGGYAGSFSGDCDSSGVVTLAAGENKTCTITNDDQAGTLIVKKILTQDNGGNEAVTDFTFSVNGNPNISFETDGENTITVPAGTYTVTEPASAGYSTTYSNCSNVVISNGGSATCTITNNDIAPSIQLTKNVINNNGGTADKDDFILSIGNTSVVSHQEITVNANQDYAINEAGLPGYQFYSISGNEKCPKVLGGTVRLNENEHIACTITNDDIAPTLKLVKNVINDQDGTASASAWTLTAQGDGGFTDNGASNTFHQVIANISYNLLESGPSDYDYEWWKCDGGLASGNTVELNVGDQVTCTATNNDQDKLPLIQTTKTAHPTSVPESGGNVTYTYTVKNLSVEPVTITSLIDDKIQSFTGDADCNVGTLLPVDGQCSFDDIKQLAGNAGTTITNLFTATAEDNETNEASASADATVTFTNVPPTIEVTKSATPMSVPETGATVTYIVSVHNLSFEPVTLTSLTDDMFGNLNGQGTCQTGGFIAAGATYQCTFSMPLASSSLTPHNNTVTAIVTDDDGSTATDNDDASVTFTDVIPVIRITKTADPTSVPETGEDVTFMFLVENIGQEDVTLNTLTDSVFGNLDGQGDCTVPQTILIGGSYSCSIIKNIKSDSLTDHYNIVTATAVDDDDGTPATDTDDETVTFVDVPPTVTIDKTATPSVLTEPGGEFNYTLTITNTSKESVTITSLTDTNTNACNYLIGTTLSAGASTLCSYSLTHTNAGVYPNTATVSVTDNDGSQNNDSDNETVTVVGAKIELSPLEAENNVTEPHTFTVTVSENPGTGYIPAAGETVTFSLPVNTANADFTGSNTCVTDVSGQCTIQINALNPGTVNLHAAADIGVHGQTVHWETNGTNGSTGDAVKTYVGGKIIIEKQTLPDESEAIFSFNPDWSESSIYLTDGQQHDAGWMKPGHYSITEIVPPGWNLTNITCQDANSSTNLDSALATINLEAGETVTCIYTNTQRGSVTVSKFEDSNANGTYDEGETLLSGWEMVMSQIEGASTTQITSQNGDTVFDVVPGDYQLSENMQPGWKQTGITCNTNGPGVRITTVGEAYGHHGACQGWNGCRDAATCAQWACEANGYQRAISYGAQLPCTQFNNCHLFSSQGNLDRNWGNWCDVMGVTDIICSNSPGSVTPQYLQQSESVGSSVKVNPGDNTSCYVGNFKFGSLTVVKYQDIDGEVGRSESERIISNPSFTFRLYKDNGENWSLIGEESTDNQGQAVFGGSLDALGSYFVCEVKQQGWQEMSSLYQSSNNLSGSDDEYPVCQQVSVNSSGYQENIEIGNQYIAPRLTIEKYNNRWPNVLSAGDEIIYTIVLRAYDNIVYNLKVKDLLPLDVVYKAGSYQAHSNKHGLLAIAPPTYASPGTWDLGTIESGEVITLTYIGTVKNNTDPGTYKDVAWAAGTIGAAADTEPIMASSVATDQSSDPGNVSPTFVGTRILVDASRQTSEKVEVIEEEKRSRILGATTLPATGSSVLWLLLSFGLIGAGSTGLWITVNGKKRGRHV